MNRRDVMALGAGIVLATAMTAEAQQKQPEPKKPEPKKPVAKGDPKKAAALLASLSTCLAKATNCDAHCAAQLANGDKSFTRCAAAVRDMLAVGQATQVLVSRTSVNVRKMVELCLDACKECSAACLEHKAHFSHGMHMECKECMEACDACTKACQAFLA